MPSAMNIQIMSRQQVLDLVADTDNVPPSGIRIVSIASASECATPITGTDVLHLEFADMLEGDKGSMTSEQADRLRDFVIETAAMGKDLIIHCFGGVARSAGCASGIIFGVNYLNDHGESSIELDDTNFLAIWLDPQYSPNQHCFKLVAESFGATVYDDFIQFLMLSNRLVFMNSDLCDWK